MTAARDFRGKFAIVGMGRTKVGHLPGKTTLQMEAEAGRLALLDSGLQPQQIDGAIQLQGDPGGGLRPRSDDSFARVLGLPVKAYFENVGRGAEYIGEAVLMATQMLDLGLADYVMLAGARDDWSRSKKGQEKGERGQQFIDRQGNSSRSFGSLRAVHFHSFFAQQHIHRFGTTPEQFGSVTVSARQWGNRNPAAYMYGRPLTMEDYLKSPVICWPYRLLDLCLISDSGTAFIVTTAERAKDLKSKPVYVLGLGFGEHLEGTWWDKTNYWQIPIESAKKDAFRLAGVTLKDIDVAEFPDCFTAEPLLQLEGFGWCKPGESGPFVQEGHIRPGGDVPINTGGGWMASHHAGSMTHLAELVVQLRCEGGDRQVPNCDIGIACGGGGELVSGQMCSIYSIVLCGGPSTV